MIFRRYHLGQNVPFPGVPEEKERKKLTIHSNISGQTEMKDYFETKTWAKFQDNTNIHNNQNIKHSPEYSQGNSSETIKTTGHQEAKYNCEQGLLQPETSQ